MSDHDVLTVNEAAALLRISPGLVYKLFHAGKLRGYQAGRAVRIHRSSVERMQNPPAESPGDEASSAEPVTEPAAASAGSSRRGRQQSGYRFLDVQRRLP